MSWGHSSIIFMDEVEALRSGLATLRSELDDRNARTIAATG